MECKWYILQVLSGSEEETVDLIKHRLSCNNIVDEVEEVLVPKQLVTSVRNGKKVNYSKKLLPGYILIKAILTDEINMILQDIKTVSRFLGTKNNNSSLYKPQPISDAEANKLIDVTNAEATIAKGDKFNQGDSVLIHGGPFSSFTGVVEEIDSEKGRLKVGVQIFGRSTQVDLEYFQVEKVD